SIPISAHEGTKRVVDDIRVLRIAEHAGTAAGVEELFVALGEEAVIFGEFFVGEVFEVVCAPPLFALLLDFVHDGTRQRVGEAEGDEVPDKILLPVREITAGANIYFGQGIEVFPQSSGSFQVPIRRTGAGSSRY